RQGDPRLDRVDAHAEALLHLDRRDDVDRPRAAIGEAIAGAGGDVREADLADVDAGAVRDRRAPVRAAGAAVVTAAAAAGLVAGIDRPGVRIDDGPFLGHAVVEHDVP